MMASRLLAAMAALAVSTVAAVAQEQPAANPATPAPAAPAAAAAAQQGNATPNLSGPQPDWVKMCSTDPQSKKEVCQISRDLRADTGQTLASVAVREIKGGKRALVLAIPPGMQIQPGVRVYVDQKQAASGKFSVCMQNACFVEADMPDALLASFKKGTTLNLQALNVQGRGVTLPVALAGFGKAYDGAALDPKVIAAEQDKLRAELLKRAKQSGAEQGAAEQKPAQ